MLYKFKSKAAGDVIMTAPVGDAVLRSMGREPQEQGILEAASLPMLIQTLEAVLSVDEISGQAAPDDARVRGSGGDEGKAERVSLKQRAWPLLEMMKRANTAGQDIVWGV